MKVGKAARGPVIKYLFRDSPLTFKNADKADAQRIGQALAGIAAAEEGKLTPNAVVSAAADPAHVLHDYFEWDDAVAAHSFRIDQARIIIRSIHITESSVDDGHASAFISITDRSGTAYRTLTAVKADVSLQAIVLAQAARDLAAWEKRYKDIADICQIVRGAREEIERRHRKATTGESRTSA